MALLQQWRDMAYDQQADKAKLQQFWAIYFTKEKDIYAELLKNPDELVRGTVKELAEKFGVDIMTMTGFLDGINDSLKVPNPIEEMEEDTVVNLGFDKALLYKNMVAAAQGSRSVPTACFAPYIRDRIARIPLPVPTSKSSVSGVINFFS